MSSQIRIELAVANASLLQHSLIRLHQRDGERLDECGEGTNWKLDLRLNLVPTEPKCSLMPAEQKLRVQLAASSPLTLPLLH